MPKRNVIVDQDDLELQEIEREIDEGGFDDTNNFFDNMIRNTRNMSDPNQAYRNRLGGFAKNSKKLEDFAKKNIDKMNLDSFDRFITQSENVKNDFNEFYNMLNANQPLKESDPGLYEELERTKDTLLQYHQFEKDFRADFANKKAAKINDDVRKLDENSGKTSFENYDRKRKEIDSTINSFLNNDNIPQNAKNPFREAKKQLAENNEKYKRENSTKILHGKIDEFTKRRNVINQKMLDSARSNDTTREKYNEIVEADKQLKRDIKGFLDSYDNAEFQNLNVSNPGVLRRFKNSNVIRNRNLDKYQGIFEKKGFAGENNLKVEQPENIEKEINDLENNTDPQNENDAIRLDAQRKEQERLMKEAELREGIAQLKQRREALLQLHKNAGEDMTKEQFEDISRQSLEFIGAVRDFKDKELTNELISNPANTAIVSEMQAEIEQELEFEATVRDTVTRYATAQMTQLNNDLAEINELYEEGKHEEVKQKRNPINQRFRNMDSEYMPDLYKEPAKNLKNQIDEKLDQNDKTLEEIEKEKERERFEDEVLRGKHSDLKKTLEAFKNNQGQIYTRINTGAINFSSEEYARIHAEARKIREDIATFKRNNDTEEFRNDQRNRDVFDSLDTAYEEFAKFDEDIENFKNQYSNAKKEEFQKDYDDLMNLFNEKKYEDFEAKGAELTKKLDDFENYKQDISPDAAEAIKNISDNVKDFNNSYNIDKESLYAERERERNPENNPERNLENDPERNPEIQVENPLNPERGYNAQMNQNNQNNQDEIALETKRASVREAYKDFEKKLTFMEKGVEDLGLKENEEYQNLKQKFNEQKNLVDSTERSDAELDADMAALRRAEYNFRYTAGEHIYDIAMESYNQKGNPENNEIRNEDIHNEDIHNENENIHFQENQNNNENLDEDIRNLEDDSHNINNIILDEENVFYDQEINDINNNNLNNNNPENNINNRDNLDNENNNNINNRDNLENENNNIINNRDNLENENNNNINNINNLENENNNNINNINNLEIENNNNIVIDNNRNEREINNENIVVNENTFNINGDNRVPNRNNNNERQQNNLNQNIVENPENLNIQFNANGNRNDQNLNFENRNNNLEIQNNNLEIQNNNLEIQNNNENLNNNRRNDNLQIQNNNIEINVPNNNPERNNGPERNVIQNQNNLNFEYNANANRNLNQNNNENLNNNRRNDNLEIQNNNIEINVPNRNNDPRRENVDRNVIQNQNNLNFEYNANANRNQNQNNNENLNNNRQNDNLQIQNNHVEYNMNANRNLNVDHRVDLQINSNGSNYTDEQLDNFFRSRRRELEAEVRSFNANAYAENQQPENQNELQENPQVRLRNIEDLPPEQQQIFKDAEKNRDMNEVKRQTARDERIMEFVLNDKAQELDRANNIELDDKLIQFKRDEFDNFKRNVDEGAYQDPKVAEQERKELMDKFVEIVGKDRFDDAMLHYNENPEMQQAEKADEEQREADNKDFEDKRRELLELVAGDPENQNDDNLDADFQSVRELLAAKRQKSIGQIKKELKEAQKQLSELDADADPEKLEALEQKINNLATQYQKLMERNVEADANNRIQEEEHHAEEVNPEEQPKEEEKEEEKEDLKKESEKLNLPKDEVQEYQQEINEIQTSKDVRRTFDRTDNELMNNIEQTLLEGDTGAENGKGLDKKSGNSKEYNEILRDAHWITQRMAMYNDGKTKMTYTDKQKLEREFDSLQKKMDDYSNKRYSKGYDKLKPETKNRLRAISSVSSSMKEMKNTLKEVQPRMNAFEVTEKAMIEEAKLRKELTDQYKKNPSKELFNKIKDSAYRTMYLETLRDEYGVKPGDSKKVIASKEKKLKAALKSGFKENITVLKNIANKSDFGTEFDKKLEENLKADKPKNAHFSIIELRDSALKDSIKSARDKYTIAKTEKNEQGIRENYDKIERLDQIAKSFGSAETAKKNGFNLNKEVEATRKDYTINRNIDKPAATM